MNSHSIRFEQYDLVFAQVVSLGGVVTYPIYLVVTDTDYPNSPNANVIVVRWDKRGWTIRDLSWRFAISRKWLVGNALAILHAGGSVE